MNDFMIIKPHYHYTLINGIDGMEYRLKYGVVLNSANDHQRLLMN